MDIPSDDDIALMDKFLKGKFENRKYSLNNSWYKEQFGLDNNTVDRILNLIGEYDDKERLATTEIIDGEFIIDIFDFAILAKLINILNFSIFLGYLINEP